MVLTRSGCYLTHDSGAYLDRFAELRKRTPEVDELGPGPIGGARSLGLCAVAARNREGHPRPSASAISPIDSRLPQPLKWFRPSAERNRRAISSRSVRVMS